LPADKFDVPCETGEAVVIRATIRPGRMLSIGPITIHWRDGIVAIIGPGPTTTTIGPKSGSGGREGEVVSAALSGGPLPEIVDIAPAHDAFNRNPEGSADPRPPVLRLGPGGDYVRDVHPEDL